MLPFLKATQIATSVAATVFLIFLYPGLLMLISAFCGGLYTWAAVQASRDRRRAIWIALLLSCATAALAATGAYAYRANGFDYFSGNFRGLEGLYLPPYFLALLAIISTAVVIMHVPLWRWTASGTSARSQS